MFKIDHMNALEFMPTCFQIDLLIHIVDEWQNDLMFSPKWGW
jgi:hypothetical protein